MDVDFEMQNRINDLENIEDLVKNYNTLESILIETNMKFLEVFEIHSSNKKLILETDVHNTLLEITYMLKEDGSSEFIGLNIMVSNIDRIRGEYFASAMTTQDVSYIKYHGGFRVFPASGFEP